MGCAACETELTLVVAAVAAVRENVAERQARSAMCATCPRRLRGGLVCGVSKRPTEEHRVGGACPLGRYPDERGVIRWRGVQWLGVPMPVRLWLVLRGKLSRPEAMAGCGCVRALKVRLRWWGRRIQGRSGRVA